jgi:epoxyqueuosine reductase QueG
METENLATLRIQLEDQSHDMGAQFFGVADLSPVKGFIVDQGGAFLMDFPRAVSVGATLHDSIVDQLPRHKETPIARTYDQLYGTVNASLNRITLRLSAILNAQGFQTLLVPSSGSVDEEKNLGLFSHKLAAHLAGLGWIGPSCLLITPEAGARVRWATLLTDSPLETGSPIPNACGDCRRCVDACPPKAFTGRPFAPDEPREMRFDVRRCIDYRRHLQKQVTGVRVCGMCIHACPFGRKDAADR